MRIPRLRFTLRRMTLAVAVLALILGGLRIVWLRDRYRRAAASYAATENLQRGFLRFAEGDAEAEEDLAIAFGYKISGEDKEQQATEIRVMRRKADYLEMMRRKYERAAARPWMPVDPDPPLAES
jgi:hypothetical protein